MSGPTHDRHRNFEIAPALLPGVAGNGTSCNPVSSYVDFDDSLRMELDDVWHGFLISPDILWCGRTRKIQKVSLLHK